jgi:hypothetical protein
MAGKRRGRFTSKQHRELIAMAAAGATVNEAVAKFVTSVETIARKARELGIRLQEPRTSSGLRAKKG